MRQKKAFCFAVLALSFIDLSGHQLIMSSPIFTYGNKATLKPGVVPEEHAIVYSYNHKPELLPGEHTFSKDPICVVMNSGEPPLSKSARIFFGLHHPVQYNVKVKDLGYVHPEHLPNLIGYWRLEQEGESAGYSTADASATVNRGEVDKLDSVSLQGACMIYFLSVEQVTKSA